jgi:hypothetical protein
VGEALVVFTGTHVGIYDVDPVLVFEAATRPERLGRWIIGEFENVRVKGGAPFTKGARFLADEALALGSREMDHLYEVIEYEPTQAFAVRCIDGPPYVGELRLRAQGGQTQISWTYSAAPAGLFDRVMCLLLYAKTRRDTHRHAERQVGKLVAIAKDLSGPGASGRAADDD